ncbi:MAG: 5-amino-6-(5-phospho-D-ribitylamino)uracil phosphatase YigB [Sodalis sp. (in: enterobacteria)]
MHFYRALQPLRALSFDLDNTLYDNRPVIARTEYESVRFLQLYHPSLRDFGEDDYRRFRQELHQCEPDISHDISHLRWRSIELAMRNAGLSEHEAHVGADAAMEVVLRWRSQIDIPEKTHRTLAALSANWPLVAITNGNVSLETCGLSVYFQYILRAGPDGHAKPCQDMYLLAAELLNLPPRSILHVGDDLEADIIGAIRYGMQACWINNHGSNITADIDARLLPHLEIPQLTSLLALL